MVGNLVFGRFISTERDEPPDIDVDFEHERREEVMQYVYKKYGGERTGLTANVVTYRSKSAMREIGKVFGLSDDTIDAINQLNWGWDSKDLKPERVQGARARSRRTPAQAWCSMSVQSSWGFPRHLCQHVGGFVITRDSLESLVPIANRRWKAAPSSNGTRTISMRWASSRSMCWRWACSPACGAPSR